MADSDVVDELPDDLNLSEYVGPYTFPNNNRRRIPATIYLVGGLALIGVYLAQDGSSALVNLGTLWGGIGLVLFGVYGLVAGWTLHVEESDALATASTQVGFAVGHASAQTGLARLAVTTGVADPGLLGREPTEDAGDRAGRRHLG